MYYSAATRLFSVGDRYNGRMAFTGANGLGPIARTTAQLLLIDRQSLFARRSQLRYRGRLRTSDALVAAVEECRLDGMPLVPVALWTAIANFAREVDPEISNQLGINRGLDAVTEALFSAQGSLAAKVIKERSERPARIIPLFGPATIVTANEA